MSIRKKASAIDILNKIIDKNNETNGETSINFQSFINNKEKALESMDFLEMFSALHFTSLGISKVSGINYVSSKTYK